MKLISIMYVILFTIVCSGCAIVTTYGNEPEKTSINTYKFELYYNMYSTDADIDKKAKVITNEIKSKNDHNTCKFNRGDTRPSSGNQSVIYNVQCS